MFPIYILVIFFVVAIFVSAFKLKTPQQEFIEVDDSSEDEVSQGFNKLQTPLEANSSDKSTDSISDNTRDSQLSAMLEDFDAKKAFVYSEIFNRKF